MRRMPRRASRVAVASAVVVAGQPAASAMAAARALSVASPSAAPFEPFQQTTSAPAWPSSRAASR